MTRSRLRVAREKKLLTRPFSRGELMSTARTTSGSKVSRVA